MPNIIDANGLQVKTLDELTTELVDALKDIYGTDINVEQDTPDGQEINIFVRCAIDNEDLLVQINNGFDPDLAVGKILDQRVAINGIQRQGGTYTITPITVVTSEACNLYGLDQIDYEVYTVQDEAGIRWMLETTQVIEGSETNSFNFRAEFPGEVLGLLS